MELATRICPRIQAITEMMLSFHDSYEHRQGANPAQLSGDLQSLGQCLLERFELEDCLIEVLHTAHEQRATAMAG